jgi:cytoskeletal protein CcmA (bactofilin family)
VEATSVQTNGEHYNGGFSGTVDGTHVDIAQTFLAPVSTSLGVIEFTLQGHFTGDIADSSDFSVSGSGTISPGNCTYNAIIYFQK